MATDPTHEERADLYLRRLWSTAEDGAALFYPTIKDKIAALKAEFVEVEAKVKPAVPADVLERLRGCAETMCHSGQRVFREMAADLRVLLDAVEGQ